MLKFRKDILVLSWIKLLLLSIFKILDLEEQPNEILKIWCFIKINLQNGIQRLETFGKLAHCAIVNWCSTVVVLLCEDLSHSGNDIFSVLIKQVKDSDIEFLMSF